ncbi:MAG: hypothetical protein ABJC09_10720 [Terriglobia bacterium]
MQCAERERLWADYNKSLDLMTSCVDDLAQPFTAATFGPRLIAAQGAKDLCQAARAAWENHLRDHGCDGAPPPVQ